MTIKRVCNILFKHSLFRAGSFCSANDTSCSNIMDLLSCEIGSLYLF